MFEPHNDGHAISEVVFSVEFDNLPATLLQKMLDTYPALLSELPSKQELSGMRFEQSGNGFSFAPMPGAEWKHFKANGNPDWIAHITPNSVSVHCLDYSDWASVWGKSRFILGTIFSALEGQNSYVMAVSLRYIDQFEYRGEKKKYNPAELFADDCIYVPESVLNKGARWHAYSGWFEADIPLSNEVLHQLNIDAVEPGPSSNPIITINHAAAIRSGMNGSLENYAQLSQIKEGLLDSFMNYAHDRNKDLVRGILSEKMISRIGL